MVGTVRTAISDVTATFVESRRTSDPFHDPRTRELHPDIAAQLSTYRKNDPPTNRQEAMPPIVFRRILAAALKGSKHDMAVAYLLLGAVFFALRSCEYSKTPRSEDQRTKTLEVGRITFRLNSEILSHADPRLQDAHTVTLEFVDQKNGHRYDKVTQWRTTDRILCPVRTWCWTVRRLRSYPDTTDSTTVDTIRGADGRTHRITQANLTTAIKAAVGVLGPALLGFSKKQCGTHSVRSSGAMWMHLAGVPSYSIMMIGRWSSDAFLLYIRRAVQEFSGGISQKMLNRETFFSLTSFVEPPNNTPGNTCNAGGLATARGRASQVRLEFPLPIAAACA